MGLVLKAAKRVCVGVWGMWRGGSGGDVISIEGIHDWAWSKGMGGLRNGMVGRRRRGTDVLVGDAEVWAFQGSGDFVGPIKTGEGVWGRAAVGHSRGKSSRTREDNFLGWSAVTMR